MAHKNRYNMYKMNSPKPATRATVRENFSIDYSSVVAECEESFKESADQMPLLQESIYNCEEENCIGRQAKMLLQYVIAYCRMYQLNAQKIWSEPQIVTMIGNMKSHDTQVCCNDCKIFMDIQVYDVLYQVAKAKKMQEEAIAIQTLPHKFGFYEV